MEKKTETAPSFASELLKGCAQALLPTTILAFLAAMVTVIVPENEIRLFPSLIDNKTFFLNIENHNQSSLSPISFSIKGLSNIHLLNQSNYADVDIRSIANSDLSQLTVSKLTPTKSTTLLFRSESSMTDASFVLSSAPQNVRFIQSSNLDSNILSRYSLFGLFLQALLYFTFFSAFNFFRRQSERDLANANARVSEIGSKLDLLDADAKIQVGKLQKQIIVVRNTFSKERLYTRRIYENISSENKMWRGVFVIALKTLLGDNRHNSIEILKPLLRKAGYGRIENLKDIDLEIFLRAMESGDSSAFDHADDKLPES